MKGGHLFINDKPVQEQPLGDGDGRPARRLADQVRYLKETNPEGRSYKIQISPGFESAGDTGVYVVPQHCYFMMGDNRDNSLDSRFDPGLSPDDPKLGGCGWNSSIDDKVGDQAGVGFVPEDNLVGRAPHHPALVEHRRRRGPSGRRQHLQALDLVHRRPPEPVLQGAALTGARA